jgi:hypothetical protein
MSSISDFHPLQCRCGTLKGVVAHPEQAIRGECYCRDCQAFARFLGKTDGVLDAKGGTDVIATRPANVSFTAGVESLACMSLTDRGLLRWYAELRATRPSSITAAQLFKVAHDGPRPHVLGGPGARQPLGKLVSVRLRMRIRHLREEREGPARIAMAASARSVFVAAVRGRPDPAPAWDGSYRRAPFFDA